MPPRSIVLGKWYILITARKYESESLSELIAEKTEFEKYETRFCAVYGEGILYNLCLWNRLTI